MSTASLQHTNEATRNAKRIAPRPQTLVIQGSKFCNLDCGWNKK